MYSETRIRQILHEFKMQRDFYQMTESYDRLNTVFKTEWEVLNNKIILLQTILEESEWQKLMLQDIIYRVRQLDIQKGTHQSV